MKSTTITNNKTIAAALQTACAATCQTVHCFRSSLPKGPAAPAYKVDLVKRPKAAAKPSSAMQGVVDSATAVAKGKPENYSAEVTQSLLAAYAESDKSDEAVKNLAVKFAKTARSIVAKLSREGVYVKKVYTTKTGGVPVSKEQQVINIAAFMGVSSDKLESLEKANKGVLLLILEALQRSAHDADNQIVGESEEDKVSKASAIDHISAVLEVEPEAMKSLKLADREVLQLIAKAI